MKTKLFLSKEEFSKLVEVIKDVPELAKFNTKINDLVAGLTIENVVIYEIDFKANTFDWKKYKEMAKNFKYKPMPTIIK